MMNPSPTPASDSSTPDTHYDPCSDCSRSVHKDTTKASLTFTLSYRLSITVSQCDLKTLLKEWWRARKQKDAWAVKGNTETEKMLGPGQQSDSLTYQLGVRRENKMERFCCEGLLKIIFKIYILQTALFFVRRGYNV